MATLADTRPLDLVSDFPAIPDGWAYLDTAATAQKPQSVVDAITRAYADARVQRIYGGTNEIMKELASRSM